MRSYQGCGWWWGARWGGCDRDKGARRRAGPGRIGSDENERPVPDTLRAVISRRSSACSTRLLAPHAASRASAARRPMSIMSGERRAPGRSSRQRTSRIDDSALVTLVTLVAPARGAETLLAESGSDVEPRRLERLRRVGRCSPRAQQDAEHDAGAVPRSPPMPLPYRVCLLDVAQKGQFLTPSIIADKTALATDEFPKRLYGHG